MLSIGIRGVARVLMGILLVSFLGALPGHADTNFPSQSSAERSRGKIDYEQFRLLSTGMTEKEVLTVAGEPARKFIGYTCDQVQRTRGAGSWQCWIYEYGDWVVEVLIESGRVQSVVNYRKNSLLPSTQRPPGEIDFETFRLISTGMTRQEVLNLAGPPAEQYVRDERGQRFERWRYFYGDDWVAEISFNRFGQVANINSYRRQ
jgi:hypothetical protein